MLCHHNLWVYFLDFIFQYQRAKWTLGFNSSILECKCWPLLFGLGGRFCAKKIRKTTQLLVFSNWTALNFFSQGNTLAPPSPKSPPNSPNLEFSDSEEINSHIYINRYSMCLWRNKSWNIIEGLPPLPARKCRPSCGTGRPPPPPPAPHWVLLQQLLQRTGLSRCRGQKSARNPPRAGALGLLQGCSSQTLFPFSLGLD